jgi:hypothetical protein
VNLEVLASLSRCFIEADDHFDLTETGLMSLLCLARIARSGAGEAVAMQTWGFASHVTF